MTVSRTTLTCGFAAVLLACSSLSVHGQDAGTVGTDETQHTAAAILAVDQHWSIAEMTGDSAWLADMLMPDYRTVNTDGSAHDKQALLSGMAKHKLVTRAEAELKLAAYEKDHHIGSTVTIHGDMAIVSFYDTSLGPQKGTTSADVFLYQDGHWHALYSQHTGVHG
ncbi:nuclear transport factor 2 family protein [Dyella choica]|nr:nuclear transport factor 2 family protein [Dyella choica]